MAITTRLKKAWNAFFNKDPTADFRNQGGMISSYRPDRPRLTRGNERSIITSIFNRIAMDCAAISIQHVYLDDNGRFTGTIDSGLNQCITLSANRDQTARAFWQDVYMSMFDEGCIALVPVVTDVNPLYSDSYGIEEIRVGKIVEWRPDSVKISVYNEDRGLKEEIILPKKVVCIIENPLYATINEYNSMFQRLVRKLNLLDLIDEQSGAGKLDLIIQFPFTINTERQKTRADQRKAEIERQLANSKYGIAYADGTEHITQLNRSIENNLMGQIEYLTNMVFNQLGMTQTVFDGTADEQTMLNYYNRTIEPILSAVVDEMRRKWLTSNARTRGQSIMFFRDPFRLVPTAQLAEFADKFTRNEIMTSNEIRQIVGMKPSDDPKADQLINSNLSQSSDDPRLKEAMEVAKENDLSQIQHSGIEGMHWGVRRYQNADGTYTELGKDRRNKGNVSRKIASDLLATMKSFRYKEYDKLMSPQEVSRKKEGSCHDQVVYALNELKKKGIDAKAKFVMAVAPDGQGGETHSFVYVKNGNGYTWIENAWENQKGIHDFSTETEMMQYIAKNFNAKSDDQVLFADFDPKKHSAGEDLQTLVDTCLDVDEDLIYSFDPKNILEIDSDKLTKEVNSK